MNHHYFKVIVCILLSFSGYRISTAQSTDPEFLDCSTDHDILCVEDEGVRLPANNQLFLGEEHPDATSCSVHVTQKKKVRSTCGDTLQYEVILFLNDTSSIFILKSVTTVVTDSLGEAELSFNTEESPVEIIRNSGIPYTRGCGDYQQIKWVISDACGGFSVCDQRIELYDCSEPQGNDDPEEVFTVVIQFFGQGQVSARDFIHAILDDCTPMENLLFSLKANEFKPDTL